MFVFARVISEDSKDGSNVPHGRAKAVFLPSLTRSLSPSFPRWRRSLSPRCSLTFSPCCSALGPSGAGSQHKDRHSLCLNDMLHYGRRITCLRGVAGSGVTRMDAILAQKSLQLPPFIYVCTLNAARVFICVDAGTTPQRLSVTSPPLLPVLAPASAPPRAVPLINRGNLCLWY